jgi:hypothetical protein
VTNSRQIHPFGEEEVPFKTRKSLEGIKICSWVPTGFETKIDCAGEDQQQVTARVVESQEPTVVTQSPSGKDLSTEAENSRLEAATYQRLVRMYVYMYV